MSQPEPSQPEPSQPEPSRPEPSRPEPSRPEPAVGMWAYRPASSAAVVGTWALAVVVGWAVAAVVGGVVAAIARLAADGRDSWADLGAVVIGLASAVAAAYLMLALSAIWLVRRFVPPTRRTTVLVAVLLVALVVGAVLMVAAFVALDFLVIMIVGTVLAVLVPALVVTRLRPA